MMDELRTDLQDFQQASVDVAREDNVQIQKGAAKLSGSWIFRGTQHA